MSMTVGALALVSELTRRLNEIDSGSFIPPEIIAMPHGAAEIGPATEQMKRLWTLHVILSRERKLGLHELLVRATHTAISFEFGAHFNCWEARIGITRDWIIYATRNQ